MTTGPQAQQAQQQQAQAERIVQEYELMRGGLQELVQKLQELEAERADHLAVVRTLEPLNGDRKCFRMIGGVLVERSVSEVLPVLKQNAAKIGEMTASLQAQIREGEVKLLEFQQKFNIGPRPAASAGAAPKSSGVAV